MRIYGDNCKYCLCARCKNWSSCGVLEGNTEQYCENDCLGEDCTTRNCSEFEREDK